MRVSLCSAELVATSTLNSWAETDVENIGFQVDEDQGGPHPVVVAVEAVAEIGGSPRRQNDQLITTQMVLIGDTDFASNAYFGSARNGDLFVNSVNYLAEGLRTHHIAPEAGRFPRVGPHRIGAKLRSLERMAANADTDRSGRHLAWWRRR